MGFLTPWFLAGVVGVGLPVWLHLLKRHKLDPRPFPSLMFFERREQSSVVHRRLDHILLFILRTLMLVILALLFANPFINRATPKASGKKMVVVAVDDSFSMRAFASGTSGETRLDKAKREALDVISGIPATTAAEVLALRGTVEAMTQPTNDPAELRGAVAAIKPSDSRASFGELARFTRTLSESSKMPIEVHLISDLQKTAMPPGFTDLRLAGDTSLILHPVGGEIPNWTVENVKAPTHVYDPKRVHIQATVAGFGTPAAKRTVSLVLNGKVVQTKQVDVPAGMPGRAQVEFDELAASYGPNRCELKIDSADALPGDDSFPFSVERADPKKILFIDSGSASQCGAVLQDRARFLDRRGVRARGAEAGNGSGGQPCRIRAGGAGRSGSAASGARGEFAALRESRQIAAGGAGAGFCGDVQDSGGGRSHPAGDQLRRARHRAIPHRCRRRFGASGDERTGAPGWSELLSRGSGDAVQGRESAGAIERPNPFAAGTSNRPGQGDGVYVYLR